LRSPQTLPIKTVAIVGGWGIHPCIQNSSFSSAIVGSVVASDQRCPKRSIGELRPEFSIVSANLSLKTRKNWEKLSATKIVLPQPQ
jgi:hypothetical protein